jgi:hypothetical protein
MSGARERTYSFRVRRLPAQPTVAGEFYHRTATCAGWIKPKMDKDFNHAQSTDTSTRVTDVKERQSVIYTSVIGYQGSASRAKNPWRTRTFSAHGAH